MRTSSQRSQTSCSDQAAEYRELVVEQNNKAEDFILSRMQKARSEAWRILEQIPEQMPEGLHSSDSISFSLLN